MPRPKRILIIRHGQSESNVDFSYRCHTPDYKIPLTTVGVGQCVTAGRTIAQIIGDEKLAVYMSPFLRTRQTAEHIVKQLQPSQITQQTEETRVREQEWGNLTKLEEINRIDEERRKFGIFFYRLPLGESGAEVYDRVSGFVDALEREFERPDFPPNVLIVTHGITLRLILMKFLGWTVEYFESTKNAENCQISELSWEENRYQLKEPFPLKCLKAS